MNVFFLGKMEVDAYFSQVILHFQDLKSTFMQM